jgi:hypothetical protein
MKTYIRNPKHTEDVDERSKIRKAEQENAKKSKEKDDG